MTAWSIVEEFLETKASLEAPRSPMGGQLAALREGTADTNGSGTNSWDDVLYRYASLVKMWASLTKEEQLITLAQHTPRGAPVLYKRTVASSELHPLDVPLGDDGEGPCHALTSKGTLCTNKRRAGEARCGLPSHRAQRCQPVTYVTDAGEEYISESEVEGYAIVQGLKPNYPTNQEIAEFLGCSVGFVTRTANIAQTKINEAMVK